MSLRSLDELEKEIFNPKPSVFESQATVLDEIDEIITEKSSVSRISLNGEYQLIDGGTVADRTDLSKNWENSVKADIPQTVHTSLFNAGIIPDPLFGKNDKAAREESYKTWWYKKEFDYDFSLANPMLCFDGVCYNAVFWLNGVFLGGHIGMFGGPFYDVKNILKENNTLIVKIENAPADPRPYSEYADHDEGWKYGVVVNCVYGWHYACIPSRGIWSDVYLADKPSVQAEKPFILTSDYRSGKVDICVKLSEKAKGKIKIKISPHNFEGETQNFGAEFDAESLHYTLNINNHKLWWPNGYGEQNLYKFDIILEIDGSISQHFSDIIGLRQIEMKPLVSGKDEKLYNWRCFVNGEYIFLKGSNWCTTDALLRFSNKNYDRFLSLAKHQNLQLLRAWGGGMPESDYFYQKCDELGLMVVQEWPTCWDSHKIQPMEALIETALIHTIRLRNHPSLLWWAGGNESEEADGKCMEELARIAYELDGTRPFRRTSPYGGSYHNYGTYWLMEDMNHSLNHEAVFMGEFGMASAPNLQSVHRYIPKEEWDVWNPKAKNAFNYHTPRFNEFKWPEEYNDMDHLLRCALEFGEINSIEDFVFGTQMAQATAIRHTLESFRANSPNSTGICYYKLTDVYPACSWSTVDYYGVPKIPYYIFKNAFAPLHISLEIKSVEGVNSYPLYLLDDNLALKNKKSCAKIEILNKRLETIYRQELNFVSDKQVNNIGLIEVDNSVMEEMLIISLRLYSENELLDDVCYFQNYRKEIGVLKNLPKTDVAIKAENGFAVIENIGDIPAIGLFVECLEKDTEFTAEDNFIMLYPNEKRSIKVNISEGLSVRGFNTLKG